MQKKQTIKQEIIRFRQFMKENFSVEDIFEIFWQKHSEELPSLSKIMGKFNIIPATSVASESSFSIAGFIQRKQRSSMSSEMLKCSIVLKNCKKNLMNLKRNEQWIFAVIEQWALKH